MGQVTTLVSSRSQGTSRMMNPLVMGATNTQSPKMGMKTTTNSIALPLFYYVGEPSEVANPRRWVWMQLDSLQLNLLPAYEKELKTIAMVLIQTIGHVPIHMQWVDLQEVLMEFSPDLDVCWFCEALMEMWTSCPLHCKILEVEGLQATRMKLWAPPA